MKGTAGETKNVDSDTIEIDLGASHEGSRTDAEVLQREGEAIQLDGLNQSQVKELRDKVNDLLMNLVLSKSNSESPRNNFCFWNLYRPKSMSSKLRSTE